MNFLTNSRGCLVQHSSLPMKCPETSDCAGLQSQEMVDTTSEPDIQPQFLSTFQGESARKQVKVVM